MRLRQLSLKNFRCFEALDLDLDRDVTLLFGVNGAGKSALVHALALALSRLPGTASDLALQDSDLRRVTTGQGDLWNWEYAQETAIGLTLKEPTLRWQLSLTRGGSPGWTGPSAKFQRDIQTRVDEPAPLPLVAVYRATRAWRDAPPSASPPEGRLAGYAGALDAGNDLAGLRAWWRDLDHHRRSEKPAPALDAAERAVSALVGPGAATPTYDTDERDVVVHIPALNGRFPLRALSDGYRGLIALVCDLARRAAQLNPLAGPELLSTVSGVVVIDEIDLHLHPIWQTTVLPDLVRAFPNVQFVVTTHSEQVISSMRKEQVRALVSRQGEVLVETVDFAQGASGERVLTELMDVPDRVPGEITDLLRAYLKLVEAGAGESADARERRARLDRELPGDPLLVEADAAMERTRLLARLRGAR